MKRKLRITFGNKMVALATLFLVVFGSLMIASAEMGNNVGDTSYLTGVIGKQIAYAVIGFASYFIFMNVRAYERKLVTYKLTYFIILAMLLSCRAFGSINGAYAWIRIGGMSLQPSEFAKVFMIAFAGRLLGTDQREKNIKYLFQYFYAAIIYFVVIALYQSDFGSAMVLFVVCFCMAYVPVYKEFRKIQKYMFYAFLLALAGIGFIMSDLCTELIKKLGSDNYQLERFLAAADPFLYRYDNGYHVVMSLISLANGNIFGLGYGNSIHKYMNFPNPSNDFILAVLVEELGIVGFIALLIGYGFMLGPIIKTSIKSKFISSKIVLIGVFLYFACHFIFNVGGVSGFIPLTGVPLLLISSGGTSLMASLMALGIAQGELTRNRKAENENNSGQV